MFKHLRASQSGRPKSTILLCGMQSVFLSRNYQLIVAPRKFDVLKTNICPRSQASKANMLVLRNQISKRQPSDRKFRNKHSIVFIVHHYIFPALLLNILLLYTETFTQQKGHCDVLLIKFKRIPTGIRMRSCCSRDEYNTT